MCGPKTLNLKRALSLKVKPLLCFQGWSKKFKVTPAVQVNGDPQSHSQSAATKTDA